MIGVSALLVVMALDGHLGLVESIVLFALVIAYTVFLIVAVAGAPPRRCRRSSAPTSPPPPGTAIGRCRSS